MYFEAVTTLALFIGLAAVNIVRPGDGVPLAADAKIGAEQAAKQTTLAERAGLTASWISKIESGQADPPWGTVRKLAAGLEISMEELAEVADRFEEAIDS